MQQFSATWNNKDNLLPDWALKCTFHQGSHRNGIIQAGHNVTVLTLISKSRGKCWLWVLLVLPFPEVCVSPLPCLQNKCSSYHALPAPLSQANPCCTKFLFSFWQCIFYLFVISESLTLHLSCKWQVCSQKKTQINFSLHKSLPWVQL